MGTCILFHVNHSLFECIYLTTRLRRSCAGHAVKMNISEEVVKRIDDLVREAERGGLVRCMSNLLPILKQLNFSQNVQSIHGKLFIVDC